MTEISEIWSILEQGLEGGGDYGRRIFPQSPANLWLISSGSPRRRRLRVGGVGSVEFEDLITTGGIEVAIEKGEESFLEVILCDDSFSELFDVLVLDVASSASKVKTADSVPVTVADRIRKWRNFLKANRAGLSREAQRGLFGELTLLVALSKALDPHVAIAGWTGPTMEAQDFSYHGRSIEVKTTAQKKPVSIEITSERQLDTKTLQALFLCVVIIDVQNGYGRTLPDLVSEIRAVAAQAGQNSTIEDLLLLVGYHDIHADKYASGYSVKELLTYCVEPDFPRIVEADCPDGVGDIKYHLQLGAISSFRVSTEEMFEAVISRNVQP